jgi:hypothetical protein
MLKNFWYVPLLLFCAWFWLREHDKLVLAQAQVTAMIDSSRVELKTIDSITSIERNRTAIIENLNSQLVAHRKIDSLKQISSARITDSLVSLLSDTIKAQEIKQSFDSERLSYQNQIASYSKQVANLDSLISSKDSVINVQSLAINTLNSRINNLVKVQKPGLLSKLASGIPYVAAGYIIGKTI